MSLFGLPAQANIIGQFISQQIKFLRQELFSKLI
jgi:hypothetical protein